MQRLARLLTILSLAILFCNSSRTLAQSHEQKTPGLFLIFVNDEVGYIDREGRIVVKPQYEDSWGFPEGMARVRTGEKWGYIDETGKLIISMQFDSAGEFSEGVSTRRFGREVRLHR